MRVLAGPRPLRNILVCYGWNALFLALRAQLHPQPFVPLGLGIYVLFYPYDSAQLHFRHVSEASMLDFSFAEWLIPHHLFTATVLVGPSLSGIISTPLCFGRVLSNLRLLDEGVLDHRWFFSNHQQVLLVVLVVAGYQVVDVHRVLFYELADDLNGLEVKNLG